MIDFFEGQMDYILFLYGLAFITLGAVCVIMMKEKVHRLPWGWLGLFGFTHAVHEWLGIIDISLEHSYPALQVFHIILITVSFIALTEFGRQAVSWLGGKSIGRWIFVSLLASASAGGLAGIGGLDAAVRYCFGLVGGLWAAYALFIASKGHAMLPRRWLLAGSFFLGLYALATGIVPPFAPFFPASIINSSSFLQTLGFPVQLARGIFAALAALSIWAFSQVSRSDAYLNENRNRHILMPVVILSLIIVSGWVFTRTAGNQARDGVLSNFICHARAYRLFSIFTTFVFYSFTIVFFAAMYFFRASAERLRQNHEHLEEVVRERTKELSEANRRLFMEVTERQQSEEKQTSLILQLESINRELNDFAYIVSHDLKEPLRAISSLSSWLADDYAELLDRPGREQIDLLQKRVARMYDLIEGILQYSRAGRISEEKVEVNLNDLVQEIVEMLSERKNISVIIEDVLPTIVFEKTRIEQVFQNLLSNAVKFMDKPDGEIRIACAVDNGYYRFSVQDNGPGIEDKHQARIFQIFQTLSSRDEFENTGIGLAMVKKIVEMYGGRVWVESRIGYGSTFYFTLPKAGI